MSENRKIKLGKKIQSKQKNRRQKSKKKQKKRKKRKLDLGSLEDLECRGKNADMFYPNDDEL